MRDALNTTIGITRPDSPLPNLKTYEDYAARIRAAGARVRVRWLSPSETGDRALDDIDGLLLSGGGDIDPAYYGQVPEPMSVLTDATRARDSHEVPLAREAARRGLPVLGICRGMQVLNVAFGGALCQHVEGHRSPEEGRTDHDVDIQSASLLHDLVGLESPTVNSYHHQSVEALAPGFVATAWAPDGSIEALESGRHPWLLAVQWHPERADEVPAEMQHLFEGLVAAAQGDLVPGRL